MTTAAPIAVNIPVSPVLATLTCLTVCAVSLTLLGLEIWKTRQLTERLDTAEDDADYAARRSDVIAEKLGEVCDYLAAVAEPDPEDEAVTAPIPAQPDTVRAPRVDVAGGARVRPTPRPRTTEGRHAA